MNATERMLIHHECERLVSAYCHYVDHGEATRIADLFTEDGVWASPEITMNGREDIRKAMGVRQANTARMSRHVCNNFLLDVIEEGHAEGTVYLTLYRHDGEPDRETSPLSGAVMVGEYRDRFVQTPDGWRFQHREIGISFLRGEERLV